MYAFFSNLKSDIIVSPRGSSVDFTRRNVRLTMDVIPDYLNVELVFSMNESVTSRSFIPKGKGYNLASSINELVNEKFALMSAKGF